MLHAKGWLSLADVTQRFFLWHEHQARNEPSSKVPFPGRNATEDQLNAYRDACIDADNAWREDAAASIWDCLAVAPEVGVLCASGEIVFASYSLYAPSDFTFVGEHIDLWVGTVGSADWMNDDGQIASDQEKAKYYGPFLYCPVMLPEQHVLKFYSLLGQEDECDSPSSSEAVRDLPQRIADAFDADPSIKKPELRLKLCRGIKVAAFEVAYQEAAKLRPELNKRGPKRRGKGGRPASY